MDHLTEKQNSVSRQALYLGAAIVGWIAVVLQLYLIIQNRVASVPETVLRFFSFYTILTNILVACCYTFLLASPSTPLGRFFANPKNFTAITVYISIVGIVYNLILRFLWEPQGLQRVVDELLHVVTPVLFIISWFLFVEKGRLKWKDVLPWLIYPFVYVVIILFRGEISGYYPYPFIDAAKLGYNKVLINSAGLFMLFLVFSLLLVAIAKLRSRKRQAIQPT